VKIYFHSHFDKKFKKLDRAIKKKFLAKLELFSTNQFDQQLRNHALKGPLADYRSINVTGDFRAIYKQLAEDTFEFEDIDTHDELYS
jgi:addiction module RelE/StbE family toxin